MDKYIQYNPDDNSLYQLNLEYVSKAIGANRIYTQKNVSSCFRISFSNNREHLVGKGKKKQKRPPKAQVSYTHTHIDTLF